MDSSLLILTEAGEKIGFGHISRCSAIEQFVKKKNTEVDLLLDWHGDATCPYKFQLLDWRKNINGLSRQNVQSVLVDSYKATLEELEILKLYFKKVIVIDDFRRLNFEVSMVINPNIYGDLISYNCRSAGGKDYVILRESFRYSSEKVSIKDTISSVLVTVGGSDHQKILPRLAQTFREKPYHFDFLCASDKYADELRAELGQQDNFNFHGILSEPEMKNIMLQCSLAISACGQSLHELAYLGVPTIGIVAGNDQQMNAESYFKSGFLIEKTTSDSPDLWKTLNAALEKSTRQARLASSEAGKKLIDGKGVERIFTLITE